MFCALPTRIKCENVHVIKCTCPCSARLTQGRPRLMRWHNEFRAVRTRPCSLATLLLLQSGASREFSVTALAQVTSRSIRAAHHYVNTRSAGGGLCTGDACNMRIACIRARTCSCGHCCHELASKRRGEEHTCQKQRGYPQTERGIGSDASDVSTRRKDSDAPSRLEWSRARLLPFATRAACETHASPPLPHARACSGWCWPYSSVLARLTPVLTLGTALSEREAPAVCGARHALPPPRRAAGARRGLRSG